MIAFFKKYTALIENAEYPLWYFVATFLFVVALRIFVELFSNSELAKPPAVYLWGFLTGTPYVYGLDSILHEFSFFTALALCIILILRLFTHHNITRLFKLVATCYGIILLVPVLDLLISAGKGFRMDYLYPHTIGTLATFFFTFFGPLQHSDGMPPGITPGIRIEVLLVMIAAFVYLWSVHKKSLLRSVAGAVSIYAVIFLFLSAPYILQTLSSVSGVTLEIHSEIALRNLFLLVGYSAGLWLLVLADKRSVVTILRDIRLPRLLHYWLMLGIGIWVASNIGFVSMTDENILYLPFLVGSVTFAWMFSVITNNMSDVTIDKVSNPERPLAASRITPEVYKWAAWITLGLSLGLALAVNFRVFFLIGVFIGNYFLYSMPPLRLKRVPFFSKLAILLNSGVLVAVGFTTFNGGIATFAGSDINSLLGLLYSVRSDSLSLLGMPLTASFKLVVVLLLLVILLAMNFIDLKDYEGDKQEGIKTLPVLLGLPLAKLLIGGAFLFLYSMAGVLIGGFMFFGAAALGLLQFYIINRGDYQEKYVFAIYLPSLLALFFIL
jgi:homogentisate phytyltransferase/homogentisate geranylgeranyltransferase